MRAHDERLEGQEPERTRGGAEAVRRGEPNASPVAALIALQRTAGNVAVVRLLDSRRGAAVQRMPPDRTPRRQAATNSPYSGRPQSARQQAQQGFDPAAARPPELPSRGPNDQLIWSGTRDDIGFEDRTVDTVLGATASQAGNGRTEYECAKCGQFVPQKRDRTPADGESYVTIDHITEIIPYVQSKAAELSWVVGGRPVRAIARSEAKRWANDPDNLRVLCAQPCNGGKRAAGSASRAYDKNKAVWWAT